MKLGYLQDVYERRGPFVTVYLDTSADTEDAAKAIELRWRAARERLAERGAEEADLRAIAEHIGEHGWRTGHRGQVLVAVNGEVILSDELPQPPGENPSEDLVHVGPLPHLMPYLRLRGPRIPHVMAIVDHIGGDLTIVHATREAVTESVDGDEHPVHKARAGHKENEQTKQNAVEELWKANAGKVADEIAKQAMSIGAKAIVLAGDVQQRKLVHEQLDKGAQDKVVETDAGHRDRKSSAEVVKREVADTVRATIEARINERLQEFEQERGRKERAVEGWQPILEAMRHGQVQTLLWTGQEEIENLAVGPGPTDVAADEQALRASGIEPLGTVPASAAVVRTLAGTSAELVLADPEKVELAEGVGAILRYTESS